MLWPPKASLCKRPLFAFSQLSISVKPPEFKVFETENKCQPFRTIGIYSLKQKNFRVKLHTKSNKNHKSSAITWTATKFPVREVSNWFQNYKRFTLLLTNSKSRTVSILKEFAHALQKKLMLDMTGWWKRMRKYIKYPEITFLSGILVSTIQIE